MDSTADLPDSLQAEDAWDWERSLAAIDPAAMLVRIDARMGALLRRRTSVEDIWQETLMHAWRDRARHRWTGARGFRAWLMEIAENRMRDAADREGAEKRGGAVAHVRLGLARPDESGAGAIDPAASSTPSRILAHRESAEAIQAALAALPDALREVVRRRLIEEQGLAEIAAALGLSHAAVKHRLRKG